MKGIRRAISSAIELLEDAIGLLRTGGLAAMAMYLIGTLPLGMVLLIAWGVFARSRSSGTDMAAISLLIAVALVWAKCWQNRFSALLRAELGDPDDEPWTLGRRLRMIGTQTFAAALTTPLLLVSVWLVLPLIWILPMVHHLAILLDGRRSLREAWHEAWGRSSRHANTNAGWQMGLFPLIGIVVLVNLQTIGYFLPWLLEVLLAMDTPLSRWTGWASSSTWMSISLLLTWMTLDLIIKAAMVLHAFRDQSRASGVDLLAAVRRFARTSAAGTVGVILLAMPSIANAQEPRPEQNSAPQTEQLGDTLDQVFQQRKYSWRKQQDFDPERTFLDDVRDWTDEQIEALRNWWDEAFGSDEEDGEYVDGPYDDDAGNRAERGGLTDIVKLVTIVLLAIAVGAAAWVVVKRMREPPPETVASAAVAVSDEPDVSDESVTADALPEDEWLSMARRLEEEGKLRLALRALFLSDLAHLAREDLLILAKHKSNRDYLRELVRRAGTHSARSTAMERNTRVFEKCWYGRHETTTELLAEFRANQREVRTA